MMEPVPNGVDIGFPFNARFDRTLFEEMCGEAFHVLGMGWGAGVPVLYLRPLEHRAGSYHYGSSALSVDLLPGKPLDLTVTRDVFCTGRMEEVHTPCPGREVLEGFAQCETCLKEDIPDPRCIFEPHCNEGTCGAFFCQAPHVVYAAVYGKRVKIGMTQLPRVRERGMEQGADVILPLVRTADRYSARQLEEWISKRYRTPQAYASRMILKDLTRKLDVDISLGIATGLLERLCRDQVVMGDILKGKGIRVDVMPREMDARPIVLGPYPCPPVLDAVPREIVTDILKGEVVGAKGKWCILRNGPSSAFRMPDLVGRLVMSGNDIIRGDRRSPVGP